MNSAQHGSRGMNAKQQKYPLPLPVIDHVVINVLDRMAEAEEIYSRLGFALTPEGRHTLGTINHLAMFGTDYMELLGVPPAAAQRAEMIAGPAGLSGIAFATEDAEATHRALAAAGAPVLTPLAFSRPVALPEETRDAAFRVTPLAPDASAMGRVFFCQHLTRGLVWRDAWRRHRNGVLGIAGVVIAAARPETTGGLFRTLFGADAVIPVLGGLRLLAGLAVIDVVEPAELRRRYGDVAPEPDGREAVMAALALRVASRDRAAAVLRASGVSGIEETAERILIPAAATMGVALELRPAIPDRTAFP
jgi:hypothetical protein